MTSSDVTDLFVTFCHKNIFSLSIKDDAHETSGHGLLFINLLLNSEIPDSSHVTVNLESFMVFIRMREITQHRAQKVTLEFFSRKLDLIFRGRIKSRFCIWKL